MHRESATTKQVAKGERVEGRNRKKKQREWQDYNVQRLEGRSEKKEFKHARLGSFDLYLPKALTEMASA